MSNEQQNSGFKYVFWGIFSILFLAFAGQIMWLLFGGFAPIPHLMGFESGGPWGCGSSKAFMRPLVMAIPTTVFFLLWVGIVGTLVFRDAKKRNMDPYLWATVTVFIPFFIGIVVYLVIRSSGHAACGSCGQPIKSEYKICPHCGHRRENVCPACNMAVASDWKVCPYCTHTLSP